MKSGTFLILLMLVAPSLRSQNKGNIQETVPTISYCELFQHPDLYPQGRLVRLKARWTYGFEWSYLSDPACANQPRAGVALVDEDKLCDASKKNFRKLGHKPVNKPANVIVIGKLRKGGGNPGDEYTFVITCLESFKTISGYKFE